MSRTSTLLIAAIAATALVGAGAAVGAAATTATPSPAATDGFASDLDAVAFESLLSDEAADPSATDRPGTRFRHRGGERFLHGEVVVKGKDGTPVTVALQRGTLTALDGDSVTVTSEDGVKRTWTLTKDTRYRNAREQATKDALKVGVVLRLAGPVTDGAATARVVGIPPTAPAATG